MHQQNIAGGKVRQKVFGATAKPGHGMARKPAGKITLERKAQVFASDFHFNNSEPLHDRLQAAADGLDFG